MKMKCETRVTRLNYENGLHARPATLIVQEASRFDSEIYVFKDTQKASAKSVIELLMLAVTDGERLRVTAEGDDAESAVESVVALIERGLKEALAGE